jgi:hypothetical protein
VPAQRVIVLDLVCLTTDDLADESLTPTLSRLARAGWSVPLVPPFPAVASASVATLFTGQTPREHGVVSDLRYDRERLEARIWDYPSRGVPVEQVWDRLRRYDWQARTSLLFFPNTRYATAEDVVCPAPFREGTEVIPWCYAKPIGFYEDLSERIGPLDLGTYWGGRASSASSEWIARAAIEEVRDYRPNLMLVCLPHLAYARQRHGPGGEEVRRELATLDRVVARFLDDLKALGPVDQTAIVVVSEFAMSAVSRVVYINRMLRDAGLLRARDIGGRDYLDPEHSRAFAIVDQQVAHIYLEPEAEAAVRATLWGQPGIARLLGDPEKREAEVDHPNSGELIAVAEADAWFAYDWWPAPELAPRFAQRVSSRRKPGYDPLELFEDPETRLVPADAGLVKGAHGRFDDPLGPRPALIAYGAGLPRRPPGPVPLTAVRDLLLGLLGHRGEPPQPEADQDE